MDRGFCGSWAASMCASKGFLPFKSWNKRNKQLKLPRLSHTWIAVFYHTWVVVFSSPLKAVQHNLSIPPLCQSMFAASKAELAKNMLRAIPERAKAIIVGGDFGGTDLVRLDSEVHRPSFKDLIKLQGRQPPKKHDRFFGGMVSNLGCMGVSLTLF